jgi:hypothetical protein
VRNSSTRRQAENCISAVLATNAGVARSNPASTSFTAFATTTTSSSSLAPGDKFRGKILGSVWKQSGFSNGPRRTGLGLVDYNGFFFVQGGGLPKQGLYCPANNYWNKLLLLIAGEIEARSMMGCALSLSLSRARALSLSKR